MRLLPQPRRVAVSAGRCRADLRVLRVHPADAARPALRARAAAIGMRVRADPRLPEHTAACGEAPVAAPPEHAGGYALAIAADGLAVHGADARGLVWGLVTLGQVLAQAEPPPCLAIADWPEYAIRYHHDDISRGQVSTRDDFRRIIRHLGGLKVSHYTPYIEDMLLLDAVPLMGEGRGALDADAVRDLVAEGERWQVEVFPTLSLAGHQENLMRLPRYRGLGARTWQPPSSFDPANPVVRTHLLRVLDAVCPLFPSPLFHMCFDEVIGLDGDAFVAHLNWCCERLVERGKTPLFWADMLYNHFGCERLAGIHPAAIPVAWAYGAEPQAAHRAVPALRRHRPRVWSLGGYNTFCSFLHPRMAEMQAQWSLWRRRAPPSRVEAFGGSLWGDVGYENHRDIAWPLIAACAEHGWSGDAGVPADVEERFHAVFHGHPLPGLTRVRRMLESDLAIGPTQAWRLHRLPAPGWRRLAATGKLPSAAALRTSLRHLATAGTLLERCRGLATAERGQLAHTRVAIDRLASVHLRALAARDARRIPAAIAGLRSARRTYRAAWLAHNRPEGSDVSLAVFDAQIASWSALDRPQPRSDAAWHPLDLGRAWDRRYDDIAGLPIGAATIDGVPFRFAPRARTHAEVVPGATLAVDLPAVPLRDLHLVATQPRDGEERRPGARLRLLRRGHVVFEEGLLAISHLCDWWAPLGDHMWAGGGLAYVDPLRVRFLLSPNAFYGLTCISRFPWPAAPVADRLELTCLGAKPLQVFAITALAARR